MRKATRLTGAVVLFTLYYAVAIASVWLLLRSFPGLAEYLPLGGIDTLMDQDAEAFMTPDPERFSVGDAVVRPIQLAISMIGTTVLVAPISWVYFITTRTKDVDRSFVQTVVVLPIVVAGIAMIVQNSLALAFSLAGVVAAVRFRFTLHEPAHALYIFAAIGIGLGAGISALGVAAVISIGFVFANLALWKLNYGANLSSPFFSFLTGRDRDDEDY